MKFMVAVLFLAAACQAEVSRNKQKEDSRADRRPAEQSAVQKRTPAVLPTVTPSATPGIEYLDSVKDSPTEKTPSQQIYVRPSSPVAKISDVLTGHGPAFPAAIASHLYSPVSIYQPRLSSPTTYEISAPVPSQLAYSEHKIAYQPQQNALQYTSQEYNQKLPNPKQAIARLTVNYQPYPQQLLVQPQPIVYSQQPQSLSQQVPVYQPQEFNQQPLQYSQGAQIFTQNQGAAFPQQQQLIQLVQAQPGITYARQEENDEDQTHQRPAQRELKTGQPQAVKELGKRVEPQQNNAQLQGAVSYASFSQGPPAPSFAQPQYQQQQQQPQPQQQQQQQQQYQTQPQYQQTQQFLQQPYQQVQYQPQPIQYQIPQYQVPQYQPAPQRQIISKPETTNLIAVPKQIQRPVTYFRQGPAIQQIQPQLYQPQVYQGQETPGYQANFPPVQYFGKFAQSIFGQHQQQQ